MTGSQKPTDEPLLDQELRGESTHTSDDEMVVREQLHSKASAETANDHQRRSDILDGVYCGECNGLVLKVCS